MRQEGEQAKEVMRVNIFLDYALAVSHQELWDSQACSVHLETLLSGTKEKCR